MKIGGFTFVRNAVRFDYPVVASIRSILPIVDVMVVAVGNSDDDTLQRIRSIGSPKLRIIETVWDETLKEGGRVLATETDKALAAVPAECDWAFYLQADEVVHEDDLDRIAASAQHHLDDLSVEGLLFDYLHFYGTYNHIGDSHRWYDREVRIIRNNGCIRSYRDAQGFRTLENRKLRVKPSGARIFHYGWVRHPQKQQEKLNTFYSYWNGPGYTIPHDDEAFDFPAHIDSLEPFKGTHPAVMRERIALMNWTLRFDLKKKRLPFKDRLLRVVEKATGRRFMAYRNYRII
ncbi:MAG: hypothetical protein RJA57_1854 [Bacteroidota bacterium]|jgi:hypothetical protein